MQQKENKIAPARAEFLMPLLGTIEGEKMFPGDPYWVRNQDCDSRTGQPKPRFRISELLDHWTFRPWFSQQKAAFDKKVVGQLALARAHGVGVEDDSDVDDAMTTE